MPQRVAVAVSGGVDSLCALLLLRQTGQDVIALYGRFHDRNRSDPLPGLERACSGLGVPLQVVDLRPAFHERVLQPFAHALCDGRTPNPCALCNAGIKFGALFDTAMELGCTHLATGHYAQLETGPDGPWLGRAADCGKDQSYFLSLVPQTRLRQVLFPLAGRTKEENREYVAAAGLSVPVPVESQDICFLPPGDASEQAWETLTAGTGVPQPPHGPIFLRGQDGLLKKVGQHRGLWRYTLGQRRGLGVAHSEGLYVLAKDCRTNSLVVGPKTMMESGGCVTGKANFFSAPAQWPERVFVRLRYRQRAAQATVCADASGCLHIRLCEKQYPGAPGQVAVVYDAEGHILAGAVVAEVSMGV